MVRDSADDPQGSLTIPVDDFDLLHPSSSACAQQGPPQPKGSRVVA